MKEILERFLNQKVSIKRMDGFRISGIIEEIGDSHFLLTNPNHADRIIMFSDVLEVEEWRDLNE